MRSENGSLAYSRCMVSQRIGTAKSTQQLACFSPLAAGISRGRREKNAGWFWRLFSRF